ncbi:MAG: transglutaminase domain-containing protein [bacterium]|nr:transglutaminase domain-containing protein [bacterium]
MLRWTKPKLIATAIVLFWLVMTGLLVRREILVPYIRSNQPGPAQYANVPTESWMGVHLKTGEPLGYVQVGTRPEHHDFEPGTRVQVTADVRLILFGERTEFVINGSGWVSRERGLTEFDFAVRSAGHNLRVVGTVHDGMLDAELHTGGENIPLQYPVGDDLMLMGGFGTTTLNLPNLQPGQEYFIDSFDPVTLSVGRTRVECIGEETLELGEAPIATKVVTLTTHDIASKAWVTEAGEVVRAETPFGFVMEKTTAQRALRTMAGEVSDSLLSLAAVRPTGKRPVRGARRTRVRLGGFPPSITPPEDDTQRKVGDNDYEIAVPAVPTEPTEPLDDATEFLAADPLIQSDHESIRTMADGVAGEGTVWERANRLNEWVYANIAKKPVVSVPSALEVLQTREGDCNEHTVLYAALARSVRIPTRVAIGVVWSEDLGGFYYHAWPEVYAGRWIWMDPTFGQPVADATHIKLLTGSIEKWTQLLPYLGQLTVEVLDVE